LRLISALLACGLAMLSLTQSMHAQQGTSSSEGVMAGLSKSPGAQRVLIDTPAAPNVPVWYLRPPGISSAAPVVFVMHGVGRDADRYLAEWAPLAVQHGFVVVVPEFTKEAFPGADAYNLGATQGADGRLKPKEAWSYAVIESAFDAVRAREKLVAPSYLLYGHSAGAQFVHRFVMLGAGRRMKLAVAANAGWYAFPDLQIDWPYGLSRAPGEPAVAAVLSAPLTVLIGDADTDPNSSSLRHTPEADAQGRHRFERGQAYYRAAQKTSAAFGVPLAWSCAIAPGLGHDNGVAARFAVGLLLGAVRVQPDAPCSAIRPTW
jgi:poly(3-hydroxybutyrate) depolymerase